ncbi:MAG: hypothetical protein M3N98_12490 [Actinomycetota bacterium]|nr:hypothetical protein [Actinomycetota bacterium]
MTDEHKNDTDQELLRLAAVAGQLDPVPLEAVMAAQSSFGWRSIDEELAELVFDSALLGAELVGVRSARGCRQLAFQAPDLAVEVEVDLEAEPQLMGQLEPPGPAQIEVRSPEASVRVNADRFGRFSANGLVGGPMSLRITPVAADRDATSTPWIAIGAAAAS